MRLKCFIFYKLTAIVYCLKDLDWDFQTPLLQSEGNVTCRSHDWIKNRFYAKLRKKIFLKTVSHSTSLKISMPSQWQYLHILLLWRDVISGGRNPCKQQPGMGPRHLQMFVHSEHIEDRELRCLSILSILFIISIIFTHMARRWHNALACPVKQCQSLQSEKRLFNPLHLSTTAAELIVSRERRRKKRICLT